MSGKNSSEKQKVLKQIISDLNFEIDNYRGATDFRIYRWIILRAIEIVEKYEKEDTEKEM
jgi:hypothetical protein